MSFKEDPNTIYHYDDQGELHNDDGPAIITPQGYKAWYKHGYRHRVDGPAVIDPHDGSKEWWFEGNLHRTDGPAVEYDDGYKGGYKEWWINGVEQPTPGTFTPTVDDKTLGTLIEFVDETPDAEMRE